MVYILQFHHSFFWAYSVYFVDRQNMPRRLATHICCVFLESYGDDVIGDDVIGDLGATDPRLIHFIRKWFLEYPDPDSQYFFSRPKPVLEGQINQEKHFA
jgi:hypothetical protein